jgi:hypothetical protein
MGVVHRHYAYCLLRQFQVPPILCQPGLCSTRELVLSDTLWRRSKGSCRHRRLAAAPTAPSASAVTRSDKSRFVSRKSWGMVSSVPRTRGDRSVYSGRSRGPRYNVEHRHGRLREAFEVEVCSRPLARLVGTVQPV